MTQSIDPVSIKITGEPQDDPDYCKFIVDRIVFDGDVRVSSVELAREHGAGSPLLAELFSIEGIRDVRVAGDTVWVGKGQSAGAAVEWPMIGKRIGSAIRGAIIAEKQSGKRAIEPGLAEKMKKLLETSLPPSEMESPEAEAIQRVLDEKINPSVADHGGYVSLVDYRGKVAIIRFAGGCQGCGMANVTLKQGIETTILREVPGVKAVQDATDHAGGENPYFQPEK